MLPPLIKEIEDWQAHAAHCASQASNATCPHIRNDFRRLERSWLQLARSYEVAQQVLIGKANGAATASRPE
jgi:hypothetical protein